MTFRIGQKVVCIVARGLWAVPDGVPAPEKDAVYTVRSIMPPNQFGAECVRLYEIRNPSDSVEGEPGYYAAGFRPVVENKTDIGFAHEIMRKARRREAQHQQKWKREFTT